MSWQDRVACAGIDARLFFGPDGEPWQERDIREAKAKAVCARCPVRVQCLDYALGNSIKHGIWGGLNQEERARERRRRARTIHSWQQRGAATA
jgi:WhiB family redox-sensing transcriptional regulator